MPVKNFGKYGRFWEMRQGGPKAKQHKQIFKCADCGAETRHPEGWNGAPDLARCSAHCTSRTDWRPGAAAPAYRDNFDAIFRGKSS